MTPRDAGYASGDALREDGGELSDASASPAAPAHARGVVEPLVFVTVACAAFVIVGVWRMLRSRNAAQDRKKQKELPK